MGLNIYNAEERNAFARKVALEHITQGKEPQTVYEHNTVKYMAGYGVALLARAASEMKPLPFACEDPLGD